MNIQTTIFVEDFYFSFVVFCSVNNIPPIPILRVNNRKGTQTAICTNDRCSSVY